MTTPFAILGYFFNIASIIALGMQFANFRDNRMNYAWLKICLWSNGLAIACVGLNALWSL